MLRDMKVGVNGMVFGEGVGFYGGMKDCFKPRIFLEVD